MTSFDRTIMIGGAAGQGLVTMADLLLTLLSRRGYHLFANQDYMSRVRGGHNFMTIRVTDRRVWGVDPKPDLLIALDEESVRHHHHQLTGPKAILHDVGAPLPDEAKKIADFPLPMQEIAKDAGGDVYANTAALGAAMALLGQPLAPLEEALTELFDGDKEEGNLAAARAGHGWVEGHRLKKGLSLPPPPSTMKRPRLAGAPAIGLGLMAGGVNFIAAYPMSPSTGVFTYVINNGEATGVITEQAEDEIAAINMAIGASAAGGRAAVTTSGGGMALMAEGISLAGIAETPVVIVDMMRPGPATGLPTRTGQEDLDFALSIGHGEFPRFLFAPGTVEQAYHTAVTALNLADKYQVPTFLLGDQLLADTITTVDDFDVNATVFVDYRLPDKELKPGDYLRYRLTDDGVSPRAYYGQKGGAFMVDSHVHDEGGHITEDPDLSCKMAEKRMAKLVGMTKEPFGLPQRLGKASGELLVVCFGSTYGAVREATERANEAGKRVGALHFNRVWPFPAAEAKKIAARFTKIVTVENNIQGQFDRLFRRETGVATGKPILRYDGRPFRIDELTTELKKRG